MSSECGMNSKDFRDNFPFNPRVQNCFETKILPGSMCIDFEIQLNSSSLPQQSNFLGHH